MRFLIAYLTLFLWSCQPEIDPEQLDAGMKRFCANMGAPIGSPNYYDCRKTLTMELIRESQSNNYQAAPIQLAPIQSTNTTNCISRQGFGNTLETTCK